MEIYQHKTTIINRVCKKRVSFVGLHLCMEGNHSRDNIESDSLTYLNVFDLLSEIY